VKCGKTLGYYVGEEFVILYPDFHSNTSSYEKAKILCVKCDETIERDLLEI